MSATVLGRISWELSRDQEGHREYKLKSLVKTTDPDDGPETVYFATGAPTIGSTWAEGNDVDDWAFCWPTARVTPIHDKERNLYWILENLFSTKALSRCQDTAIESPLSEPQRISGSFVKYVKDTHIDGNGDVIISSSHELIDGVERDFNRPSVVIEQNVLLLGLPTFAQMIDTVNDATLWGLPEGCVKLSNAHFERKLYGTCSFYYTRRFEFDIRYEGFDITDIVDTGYKKFDTTRPGGDRTNPEHYVIAKDGHGENSPKKILLDGNGDPLTDPTSPVFLAPIELYGRSNFTTLGIPTSL